MENVNNTTNREMFLKETNLYEVEPISRSTQSWMDLADVPDEGKARTLDLTQLRGKKLYAKFVRKGDRSYWRMYIVDCQSVQILYVNTFVLEPGRLYKP